MPQDSLSLIVLLPHFVVARLHLHPRLRIEFMNLEKLRPVALNPPAFIACRTSVPARCRLTLARSSANYSRNGDSSGQLFPTCSAIAASFSELFAYIFVAA